MTRQAKGNDDRIDEPGSDRCALPAFVLQTVYFSYCLRHNFYRSTCKYIFMEKMNDLKDLLKHEIQDLYSVEEQIIKALPNMIEKARNPELKKALSEHLRITEQQKKRLDEIQQMMFGEQYTSPESEGLFGRLFKKSQTCRGMQGIIDEGNKIMNEDMSPEVLDAAIIACAQKVEHYEICGYGTARTYARELDLNPIAELLEKTLNEEYEADDKLTYLAVSRLNEKAENAGEGAASASGNSRSGASKRETPKQRVRQEEMETEMVSNSRTSGAAGKSSENSRGGARPKETATPRNAETGRSATPAKRSSGTASKATASRSGRSGSDSRSGSSSGRGDKGSGRARK
jgi:ferritin-like metal-binding protein YciE